MKRIKAACICQTVHFMLKEDVGHDYAVRLVREEVAGYKSKLESERVKHVLLEETEQPDGSVIIKIRKQYNRNDVGDYLSI